MILCMCLDSRFARFTFCVFFFLLFLFFFMRFSFRGQLALFMHCSLIVHILFTGPTSLYLEKILKMSLTTLFTHLKIILLQCLQFSVFSKISCIQTDPICEFNCGEMAHPLLHSKIARGCGH